MITGITFLILGALVSYWIARRFHRKSSTQLSRSESSITNTVAKEGTATRTWIDSLVQSFSDWLATKQQLEYDSHLPSDGFGAFPSRKPPERISPQEGHHSELFLRLRSELDDTTFQLRELTISALDLFKTILPHISIGATPVEIQRIISRLCGPKCFLLYKSLLDITDFASSSYSGDNLSLLNYTMKKAAKRECSLAFQRTVGVPLTDILAPLATNGLIEVQGGEKDKVVYLSDLGRQFSAYLDKPLILPDDRDV